VTRDKPYDSAGGFKVEALGISLFDKVDTHDPTALVGLPLIWLAAALRKHGFTCRSRSATRSITACNSGGSGAVTVKAPRRGETSATPRAGTCAPARTPSAWRPCRDRHISRLRHRIARVRGVHANLVRAAGAEIDIQQRRELAELLDRLERRHRVLTFAVHADHSLPPCFRVGLERQIDRLRTERPAPATERR
jgi:hypothetical protein